MTVRKNQQKLPRVFRELPRSCGPSRRYRATKVLGKGCSGVVLQATLLGQEHRRRQVALKFRYGADEDALDESFIQSLLHHPNIVEFYRAFHVDGGMCMILQLCVNRSLYTLVHDRGCLTEPEIRVYTLQIAGAVQYMHSKDVVHRDLKLKNILLDANMDVKVADFGLATILSSSSDRIPKPCGTLNYMAPEMFQSPYKGYDKRVDLWSMGVIIYTLLVGSLPFSEEDPSTTRVKICNIEYKWPELEVKWPSDDAKGLVENLLVEAQDRFTTAEVVCHPFFIEGHSLGAMYLASRTNNSARAYRGIERDHVLRQLYCRLAGVGKDENGEDWPCVGLDECPNPIGDRTEGTLVTLPFKWPF